MSAQDTGERLSIRPRRMDHRDQVRGGERRGTDRLQRVVGAVDGAGQLHVPRNPLVIGEFGQRFRREDRVSRGNPFVVQKNRTRRAGMVAQSGEQDGIAKGRLILVAAHQSNGDGGSIRGLARAPATGPDGRLADKLVQRFQGNAGGERAPKLVWFTTARQNQPGNAAESIGEETRAVTGECMTTTL